MSDTGVDKATRRLISEALLLDSVEMQLGVSLGESHFPEKESDQILSIKMLALLRFPYCIYHNMWIYNAKDDY